MERSLGRMLRGSSRCDFVIDDELGKEEEAPEQIPSNPPDSPSISSPAVGTADSPMGLVPLVPHFVIPWRSGVLVPGQISTLVHEAFSRCEFIGI